MKMWNPWKENARLREQIARLEGRLDEVCERAEEAEARAFDRAARYWQFQVEREREQRIAAMNSLVTIQNLQPPTIISDALCRMTDSTPP